MIVNHLLNYENVTLVACNNKLDLIQQLKSFGIKVNAIDYDPKFYNLKESCYEIKDFIFDKVYFGECVVNFNCEKTYPLGMVYTGDMILIGDNDQHNGDCNPISSCEQLIEQNKIIHVYESYIEEDHFIVYGTNIS